MSRPSTDFVDLSGGRLGTARRLAVRRYGRAGARPKAYLQAALHADELPGVVVLDHLEARLAAATAAGRLIGEVVVVPLANPIGLDQHIDGRHLGRFDLASGENFNRHHPDLADALARRLAERLSDDAAANVAAIRAAMLDIAAARRRDDGTELGALRWTLFGLACDADLVLDLHCDFEAVMHVYTSQASWPDAADLAAQMGSRATLLARASGDNPFDETFSRPWIELAERFAPRYPIPQATLSATVELRGETDIDDSLAAADADNLYRFLQRRGVIAGDPGPLPAALCDATPLSAVDMVTAPTAGVVTYCTAIGAQIRAGEPLGSLLDPIGGRRTAFSSRTDGVLYGRVAHRLVRPGQVICKVAGATPLAGRTGNLLTA